MKLMSQTIGLAVLLSLPVRLIAQSNVVVAPLPPLDFVIQHVVAESNRENDHDHAFRQHYSFTRIRVTEYRSSEADLKSTEKKPDTISRSLLRLRQISGKRSRASRRLNPAAQASRE